jgi:hypothetical protein
MHEQGRILGKSAKAMTHWKLPNDF